MTGVKSATFSHDDVSGQSDTRADNDNASRVEKKGQRGLGEEERITGKRQSLEW